MRVLICLLCMAAMSFAQPFPEVLFDRSGQGPSSGYGARVYSLGDQNDDGFMDWVVWAQGDFAGQPSESMAEFFYGGDPPSNEPYLTITADPILMIDLVAVRTIGDVNGDGYIDWVEVFRYRPDYDTNWYEVYLGGPVPSEEPVATFLMSVGDQSISGMGGDFNGDGYDDLYSFDNPTYSGLIYYGSEELDTIPDLILAYGGPADGFGDLNGDSRIDLLTVQPGSNVLYVFLGGDEPDAEADIIWEEFQASWTRIINDLNGDGRDEIVAARGDDIDIHYGGNTISQTPSVTLNFDGCPTDAINELSSIGDFNDDGYGDFAAFSWGCANGHGKMALYLGHRWMNPDAVLAIVGRTGPLNLVGPFDGAGLGDVNGDQIDDFAIGAWNSSHDGARGRCVVLAGNPEYIVPVTESPPSLPENITLIAYPNPFNAETTIELEVPVGTGTIDLKIFNTLGQIVHSQKLPAWGGKIKYRWDGTQNGVPVSTGIYIVQATFNHIHSSAKLVVLR
jgi:hypothetical protein